MRFSLLPEIISLSLEYPLTFESKSLVISKKLMRIVNKVDLFRIIDSIEYDVNFEYIDGLGFFPLLEIENEKVWLIKSKDMNSNFLYSIIMTSEF